MNSGSRRDVLKLALAIAPMGLVGGPIGLGLEVGSGDSNRLPVPDQFPTQAPELVREVVTVAHYDLKRVRELVELRPSLARAAWDWGFGDWETALGAASHMGNRPMAEYLISKGARPSLFSAAMLGQVEVIKAFVSAQPGVERIEGPHGIPLLAHAKAGGDGARAVLEFLTSLGDAGAAAVTPISEADLAVVAGTYGFGESASQRIVVSAERGLLTWTRAGTMGRPLSHLGGLVFYPAGASSVRIKFAENDSHIVMTVEDGGPALTARKL